MLGMHKRHRMIEIAIGGQNDCPEPLRPIENRLVIFSEFTGIRKQDRLVSGCGYDFCSRPREVLIQQELHAMAKLYGVSSNRASDPAKSNTAEMSSDVMLG